MRTVIEKVEAKDGSGRYALLPAIESYRCRGCAFNNAAGDCVQDDFMDGHGVACFGEEGRIWKPIVRVA